MTIVWRVSYMPLPGQFCLSGIVRGSWSDMFWLYPLGSCLSNSVFMHCGVSFAFLTAAMAGPDACFSWNWCALSEPAWRCAVHVRSLKPVAIYFSLIFFLFFEFFRVFWFEIFLQILCDVSTPSFAFFWRKNYFPDWRIVCRFFCGVSTPSLCNFLWKFIFLDLRILLY